MTYQELYAKFQARCASDPLLRSLKKKITSGKADFTESAAYAGRISDLLGGMLSENIELFPLGTREATLKWLLREQYKDIGTICAVVQQMLDARDGLQLEPQQAPFPAERVEQLAHSLEDLTVPIETIKRRAGTGTANVSRSFHDDFIKENAKLRNDLGLKCYITRTADADPCKWCASLAGRYAYGTEPPEVYQRHDNCGCKVIYENGRQRQDVWTKRSWEVEPAEVQGTAPKRFLRQQAEKLQENARDRLTFAWDGGIIDLGDDAMFRRKKEGKIEPMPKRQFQRIVKSFKAKGGIMQSNEETDKYLESRNAEAITYDANTILIRQKPGRASVFEELIHTAQYRNGRNDGSYPSRLRCEIEAQEKLLKYAKAYKLTEPEIFQTQKALEAYQKELSDYLKNGGE